MAQFTYPQIQTTVVGGATEAKQDDIITELQQIEADIEAGNVTLASIDSNTSTNATETTLSALNTKVTAVDTTGKATEAKQDDAITELQQIEADIEAGNVILSAISTNTSTNATETTLSALNAKVTAVDTGSVTVSSSALPTGAATSANQGTANTSLSNIESDINDLNARLAGNLVPETFDFMSLTYVAAGNGAGEIETVTYKTGGSGGTTVATLTLTYDASDRISTVTRS